MQKYARNKDQCDYSISFQVDYQPEPPDQKSPWALSVHPFKWSGELSETGTRVNAPEFFSERNAADTASVHLTSGDGLIYRGRELVHWHDALPAGAKSTSLFFH